MFASLQNPWVIALLAGAVIVLAIAAGVELARRPQARTAAIAASRALLGVARSYLAAHPELLTPEHVSALIADAYAALPAQYQRSIPRGAFTLAAEDLVAVVEHALLLPPPPKPAGDKSLTS